MSWRMDKLNQAGKRAYSCLICRVHVVRSFACLLNAYSTTMHCCSYMYEICDEAFANNKSVERWAWLHWKTNETSKCVRCMNVERKMMTAFVVSALNGNANKLKAACLQQHDHVRCLRWCVRWVLISHRVPWLHKVVVGIFYPNLELVSLCLSKTFT